MKVQSGMVATRLQRNRLSLLVALAVTTLMSLIVASSAAASSSTLTITSDTTLSDDHQGTIVVASDNVTLNCAGHTVTGPGTDGYVSGILINGRSGVTVKNCRVAGFHYGIRLIGAMNADIRANTVTGQSSNGVYSTDGGMNNSFRSNSVVGNASHGIIVGVSIGGEIVGNVATGNGSAGIALVAASTIRIARNTASDNGWSGILLVGSSDNTIQDNRTEDNTQSGISLSGTAGGTDSNNNTLTGNTATGNEWFGIDLAYFSAVVSGNPSSAAFSNTLKGNMANANAMSGFGVFGDSSLNMLQDNRARNNGEFDAQDASTGTGNTWLSNSFGTTDGV